MPEAKASTRLRIAGRPRRPAAFHEALAAEEGLRKAKGERTRVRLMASGCELLQTTTVDSLMISRVSSQAGVAKGAFYIYFDSRSAFLEELCREYVAYEMSTFPELDLDMDAYNMVRTIVAWYADVFRKNSGMIRCLVRMTDVEETFAEIWNRRNREIADRIVSFLCSFLDIRPNSAGPLRELVNALGDGMDQALFARHRIDDAWHHTPAKRRSFVDLHSLIIYRAAFGGDPELPKSSRFRRLVEQTGRR